MSLLWRDRIQAFLAADQVVLSRSSRGLKPKAATRVSVRCEPRSGGSAWESPLDQLEQMVAGSDGAEMVITLSNRFVRYAVLPAQKNIANSAELNAYAEFHMREIYGERMTRWVLGISTWDPRAGGVCAAIEHGLAERLEEFATRHKIRLKYVEPYFTGEFDRSYKRLNGNRAWFALVETGCFCFALLDNGAWQRISSRRIMRVTEDELIAVLDQEAVLFSGRREAIETVYLCAPEHPELAFSAGCGWQAISLQSGDKPMPPHYPSVDIGAAGKN